MNTPIPKYVVVDANRAYYDAVAETYLQNEAYAYTDEIVADVRRLVAYAADAAGVDGGQPGVFLDLGCGSGFLSRLAADLGCFGRGIGVDISPRQVELYNRNLVGTPFSASTGDAAHLNLADGTVDLVGGYSVLHHFHDYIEILEEVHRVLKPGGCLYFDFEPNPSFKRRLKPLIRLRRRLVDAPPTGDAELEYLAEFHNNYSDGVDLDRIRGQFDGRIEPVAFGYRFPGTFSGQVLRRLSRIGPVFCPLFYVILRKMP